MSVQISTFGSGGVSAHLARWKPVLRRWGKLMDHYQVETEGHLAFAYNERACVGMLALAICSARPNNLALEEYRCGKRIPGDDGVTFAKGRADLWARLSGEAYSVEAKLCWISCQKEQPWLGKVKPAMAKAMQQARALDEESDWLAAAVFAVPYATASNDTPAAGLRKLVKAEHPKLGRHSGLRADYYPVLDDDGAPEDVRLPGVSLFLAFRQKK